MVTFDLDLQSYFRIFAVPGIFSSGCLSVRETVHRVCARTHILIYCMLHSVICHSFLLFLPLNINLLTHILQILLAFEKFKFTRFPVGALPVHTISPTGLYIELR